jgi:hypothetical protein
MRGVIWNCRGLAKKGMGTCLKDLLLEFKADFVGLQETMRKNTQIKFSDQLTSTRDMPGTGCPQMAGLVGSYEE